MIGYRNNYRNAAWFTATFLLVFMMNLSSIRSKSWTAPDPPGDTQDYYSIALNLWAGKGFAVDWDDPAWRLPYDTANGSGHFSEILSRHGHYPTAYRPPAVPLLMAVVCGLTKGYFFLAWRLVDSFVVALAAAAATVLARRTAGVTAAVATMVLYYWNGGFLRQYVPRIMTEGISTLAVMLLVYTALLVMERKRLVLVAVAGLTTGFLILVRSIFVFWLPGLSLLMMACWQWRAKGGLFQAVRIAALYLAVALATVAPWWVRNCIVLGKFMPLGTQGGCALPGGYSDLAVENRGNWTGSAMARIWESYTKENDVTGLTLIETELRWSETGQRAAVRWMKDHWAFLPRFALRKAVTEWRAWQPRRVLVLLGLCLLGSLLNWRRHPQVIVLWFVIIANTLTIIATYAVNGRFLIPVLFPCYILIGVGITEWLRATRLLDDYLGRLGHEMNKASESGIP